MGREEKKERNLSAGILGRGDSKSREREREKERKVVGERLLILVTFTSGVRDPVRVRVAPQKLHSTLDAALFQPVFYSRRISSPLFSSLLPHGF